MSSSFMTLVTICICRIYHLTDMEEPFLIVTILASLVLYP